MRPSSSPGSPPRRLRLLVRFPPRSRRRRRARPPSPLKARSPGRRTPTCSSSTGGRPGDGRRAGHRELLPAIALGVLVAAGAAGYWFWSQPAEEPAPVAKSTPAPAAGAPLPRIRPRRQPAHAPRTRTRRTAGRLRPRRLPPPCRRSLPSPTTHRRCRPWYRSRALHPVHSPAARRRSTAAVRCRWAGSSTCCTSSAIPPGPSTCR